MLVLTFANYEKLEKWDKRDLDDKNDEPSNDKNKVWDKLKRERFVHRVQLHKKKLNEFVKKHLHVQNVIMFEALPAGYCDPRFDNFLSEINWKKDLLATCYNEVKVKHKFSKLKLNKSK